MPYVQKAPDTSSESTAPGLRADLLDAIQVFVYTNLSIIISPNPVLVLPNSTKSVILAYVNAYPGTFLPRDIQEVADAWVLTHVNSFSEPTPSFG